VAPVAGILIVPAPLVPNEPALTVKILVIVLAEVIETPATFDELTL
jgi:hypothetical protein